MPASGWTFGASKTSPRGICIIVDKPVDNIYGNGNIVVNSAKGQIVQYHGTVNISFSTWVTLSLYTTANFVSASVNGLAMNVTNCTDCNEFPSGYVALTSGWNMASFDDFSTTAAAPPPPPKDSWIQTLSVSESLIICHTTVLTCKHSNGTSTAPGYFIISSRLSTYCRCLSWHISFISIVALFVGCAFCQ